MGLDTIRKRSAMLQIWADSSVGRALPLQGRGHRFNPCSAYQACTFDPVLPKYIVDLEYDTILPGFYSCRFFTWGGRRSAWLGRQIVNLEVAGSNPVGPATFLR